MMNSVKNPMIYVFVTGAVLMFLTSCSGTPEIGTPPPDSVCSSIVNDKCTKCHYKTRICEALGKKSPGKWVKTINIMVKNGAQLTEDEKNKVIACLSSLPEGSTVICQ
jgi:hypothetical protein